MEQLRVQDLSFSYGARPVLDRLTVSFPAGRLIGVVGPNGCGKSTLASLLARLRDPTGGTVTLEGKPLGSYSRRALARKVAFLPQSPQCPRGITVEQILRYGRQPYQTLFRQFAASDAQRIAEVVHDLQLGDVLRRPMDELSGGQRQRAWLGMTLVQDTDVVLLDEPTSALDIGHQHEVMECIRAVVDRGKTVVLVIHDLAAAARFCDVLLAMKDGRALAFGAPRDVMREELILDLYGLHVEIMTARVSGAPVIVPVRTSAPGGAS